MSVDTLPSPEECNCFAVRAAARHVTQSYDQFLAPIGLRTTQFSILAKLKRKGPLTINALAEDMVMDRTTLGRNILPLERDGLIRVAPAALDRRAKDLHLTKAGEKRFLAALKRWSAAQARFDTVFGAKRGADLRALLRAVVASEFAPADHGGALANNGYGVAKLLKGDANADREDPRPRRTIRRGSSRQSVDGGSKWTDERAWHSAR